MRVAARTKALFAALALTGHAAAGDLVVHAGHLLDQPGKAARGASTLVVRGGKVAAVEDGFRDAASLGLGDAQLLDLREAWVVPGLIDCHVHLDSDAGGQQALVERATLSDAAVAYNTLLNAQKTLRAGFTTVRNLNDATGATLALRDAVAAGALMGPRIVDAGVAISTTSGHLDRRLSLREDLHDAVNLQNVCDGTESCRTAVRRQIGRGVDLIKITATGGVNSRVGSGIGAQVFEDEVRALVDTAHLYGKKLAVHAHGADGIRLALAAGADSIEHGTLLGDEEIKLFLKSGAYYVPTLSTVNGYLERIQSDPEAYSPEVRAKIDWRIRVTGEAVRKAYPRGVKIAFGTDAGVSKHGRNADEFELMVKHGMSAGDALKAATVNAADLLGLSDQIGTLEVGKQADMVAVSADPLGDITTFKKPVAVVKGGVPVAL